MILRLDLAIYSVMFHAAFMYITDILSVQI